jgi:hypothetical protein
MLTADSASLLEFVGTLVTEIKTKSNPKKEWSCNLHMGTHPTQRSDQRGWGEGGEVRLQE